MMKNETLKSALRAALVFGALGAFAVLMGLLSAPLFKPKGNTMPKATIPAGDIISDLIDALRERQVEDGSTYADASAFTLGYIGSALGGFIDGLTPKAKATILADLESRIRTVNDIRAKRRAEAIMARSASI